MKYKVGDKVKIREDLVVDQWYGDDIFTPEMSSFKGQVVTITKIRENKYVIEEDSKRYYWTDDMFSGKVSEDFSPEEPISQNTLPKEENSSDIITVKTTKVKLLLL